MRAGVEVVATNNVHYATPARRPLAQALAAVRARRSLDEIDGWLPAAPFAHLRSAGRAAPPVRALAGRGRTHGRDRARVRVRPEARGAAVARLRRCPTGTTRCRGCGSSCGGARPSSIRRVTRSTRRRCNRSTYELQRHRAARLPRLLLVAARHRRVLPPLRHLLPGAGERGEQRGLLRARRHQGRRGRARVVVRTVPVARTRRPARHRPRHRAPTARRGDPVRLRTLRTRSRRAGGQRDHVPAPFARCGRWRRPRASRPARPTRSASGSTVGPPVPKRSASLTDQGARRTNARSRPRNERRFERTHARPHPRRCAARRSRGDDAPARDPAARARARERGDRLPAPPRHPLRRHGDGRPSARRVLPDRVGAHGGPFGAPVGQGRLRGRRAREVRPARPRHADDAAPRGRHGARPGRRHRPRDDPAGERGVRPLVRGRHRRRVPGGEPGADGDAAAPAAARRSTTSWSRSRSSVPARSRAVRCTRTCGAATARRRSRTSIR